MIKEAIETVVNGRSLTFEQAAAVMENIMIDEATPAQFAAFVTALRMKGEAVDEIAGLDSVMQAKAAPVQAIPLVLETCGTGGDNLDTFNISTGAALVAAAAGVPIAKHGNRSVSSACGSADVLIELGVNIDLEPDAVSQCIDEVGIGFLFAPSLHPAMKLLDRAKRDVSRNAPAPEQPIPTRTCKARSHGRSPSLSFRWYALPFPVPAKKQVPSMDNRFVLQAPG